MARRPISEVQADPKTSMALRQTLSLSLSARKFATTHLGLPDNASYTTYADVQRPYVVWNVFAAPPLSLQLRESCFVIAGCVSYRGFFSEARARLYAAERHAAGDDVYLGGIAAYSTLGWFDDPVLNTMLRWTGAELVKTIFHELAHQLIYVTDDSAFNESFATTVANAGFKHWQTEDPLGQTTPDTHVHDDEFIALLQAYRDKLTALYAGGDTDPQKIAAKQQLFSELQSDYAACKVRWQGDSTYDDWMQHDLNNAKLGSIGTYYDYVPAFTALLDRTAHDLSKFYTQVRRLAALKPDERAACLRAYARHTPPAAQCVADDVR